MKRLLFLSILILSGSSIFAQSSKRKTGPKAKNTKVWEQKKAATILTVNSYKKQDLTAPELKNQKIWSKQKKDTKIIVQRDLRRKNLKGPEAKNFKPWKN